MGQDDINKEDELISVKPLFDSIASAFKSLLRILVSIIVFYKRKALLFAILIVVGIIIGFFLDKSLKTDTIIKQEVVLRPNYDVETYLYPFIKELQSNLGNTVFFKKIKFKEDQALNIQSIELKPIIEATDVLDGLHVEYGDKEYFHHIIEDYDKRTLEDEKYRSFYKYHKLKVVFKRESAENDKVSNLILDYISSNDYFNKLLSLNIQQARSNLNYNKETLGFIDEYLMKTSSSTSDQSQGVIIFGKESELTTISSLIQRKIELLEKINEIEEKLLLDNELFNILEYQNVISVKKEHYKRMVFLMPVFLFALTSLLFLIKFVYTFVKE